MRDEFVLEQATLRAAIVGILTGIASPSFAADGWYFGADRTRVSYDISDTEFQHDIHKVHVGTWLEPGIGVELFSSVDKNDDLQSGLRNDITRYYGANLRLQSPDFKPLKAYVTLGYAELELTGQAAIGNVPGAETFKGGRASFGLLTPVWEHNPRHWVGAEVAGFSNSDGFSTTNFSLFYRFEP